MFKLKQTKTLTSLTVLLVLVAILNCNITSAVTVDAEKYYYKGYAYATGIGELDCCGTPVGGIQENNAATIAVSSSVYYTGSGGKARIKTYTRNGIVKQWYSRNYAGPGKGDLYTPYATAVNNEKIVTIFSSNLAVDNFIAPDQILPKKSSTTAIPGLGWLAEGLNIPYLGGIVDTALFMIQEASGSVTHVIGTNNEKASIYLTSVPASKTEIPPSVGVATADQYVAGVYNSTTGTYQPGYEPKSIGAVSNFVYSYKIPKGETRNLVASAKAYYDIFMNTEAGGAYRVSVYTRQADHYFSITGTIA